MHNQNELTIGTFLLFHIQSFLCILIWSQLYQVPIEGLSLLQSIIIFVVLSFLIILLGILLTSKHNKNIRNAIANTIIPFEIMAMYTYYDIHGKYINTLFTLSVFVMLFKVICTYKLNYFFADNKKSTVKEQIKHFVIYYKNLFAVCFSLYLAVLLFFLYLDYPLLYSHREISKPFEQASYSVDENVEMINKLEYNSWITLDIYQKLDVLQTVVDIESYHLGIPYDLTIGVDYLDENVLGFYRNSNKLIAIDTEHLLEGFPEDILETVCHEVYHAYQYSLVDAYSQMGEEYKNLALFSDIEVFVEEISDKEEHESFYDYYYKLMEIKSRNYSQVAVLKYYEQINNSPQLYSDGEWVLTDFY